MPKTDFKKIIQKNQGKPVDPQIQAELNKPWSDPKTALTKDQKSFLDQLIRKIQSGDIVMTNPESILNNPVYEKLSPEQKREAEMFIHATLALIRRIKDFYDNPYDNNADMMIDMITDLMTRVKKLESSLGDVLKI